MPPNHLTQNFNNHSESHGHSGSDGHGHSGSDNNGLGTELEGMLFEYYM
ncbi:10755_t:CDS:2 [Gigaspora margarita]|uniref:10755_t:CDS:1 n=1 Tax=Gigaspora margarita TaxID=4874 RepID=A0ABN7VPB6_GIGMA|nr:10755_t:CDS:2 [Gigaspora margarita]